MADDTGIRSKGKDRWEIRFSANGTPVSRMFKGTKKEAQRERRRYLREAEAGKWNHREKTFQVLADEWFALAQRKLSPTTVRAYAQNLRLHILPALGPIPLHRLSVADLDKLYLQLEDEELAPRTIKQNHAIISRALRQGRIWGWVHEDLSGLATLPRVPESELHPPTAAQVHQLIATAEESDPLLAVVIFVAADTGARRGELCGLRWPDLDLEAATLTIRRAVIPVAGGTQEKDTKTHQRRTVALWPTTVEAVARHRQNVLQGARLARVEVQADAYMFSREPDGSTPLHPDMVSYGFGLIRRKAKIKARFHDLRHFVGTELVSRGVPITAVSRRLGHRHASTTTDIYARHSTVEADRQASQVIGELLSPDAQKPRPLPAAEPTEDEEGVAG